MYKIGQIILLIGIIMIIINAILLSLNTFDTKITSLIFLLSLILVGTGSGISLKYKSKK